MHPRENITISWKSLSWKVLIAVLLAAALAAPVLAEYLGPDRVRTTYDTETFSYGDWVRQDNTPGNTMCDHSLTGSDYCVICSWERDPYTASCANEQPGDFYYTLGTRTETVAHTTTYPPATISASLSGCTLVNGWCASPSSLVLTGSEPVSGYTILAIEGTINGGGLGCSGASCTVPLSEGANAFTYWAFSDWGDTSEMGSTSQGQDTQPPTISGTVNGTTGDNGWYITNAVVSASAADAVSGASLTFSLDGASPAAYTGALTLTDGTHTVVFSAVDGAGHTASAFAAANVDTSLPSAGFTSPAAGWVNGAVTVSGTASDATSGLAQVQLSLDGGSIWQSMGSGSPWSTGWDTTSAGDGTHTLQVYSVDQAGNSISPLSVTVNVDNTPPQLSLSAPGAFCAECGESIDLTYSVQDNGVGVANWQISVDGTPLISGAAGVGSTFSWDGSGLGTGDHSLVLTGMDGLGNSDSIAVTVRLEAEPPVVPPVVIINTSRTATPTATSQALPHSQITLGGAKFASGVMGGSGPTPTARPTTNSGSVTFGSVETGGEAAPQAEGSPNLLWGLGALGLIGAVTAAVLEERRKRKEEEARQLAEAQAKAVALNAAEEQKKVENYLKGKASLEERLSYLRNAGTPLAEVERIQKIASKSGLAAAISEANDQISKFGRINSIGQLAAIEQVEARYQDQYREVTTKTGNLIGPSIARVSTDTQSIWQQASDFINLRIVDPVVNYFEGLYYSIINPPDDRGNLFRFSSNDTDPTLPNLLNSIFNLTNRAFQNEIHYDEFLDAHPVIHTTLNVVNNIVSYAGGFSLQVIDDFTFGLIVSNVFRLDNGSSSFQYGRQAGRVITTFAGIAELIGGAITAIIGFGSIPPTAGIGAACTVATGGACVVVLGVAIPLELAFGLAGTAVALHGGFMMARIINDPVPTARDLDPTLSYRSNTGNTSSNSRRLRDDLEANDIHANPDEDAHHLVGSTSQNPYAIRAREILNNFGIDINQAENGVFLEDTIHHRVHTNMYYEAVFNALNRCDTSQDVVDTLLRIRERLSITGHYP